LSIPDDQASALDIIDLWLDDDSGLSKIDWSVRTVLWHYFPNAQIHSHGPNPAIHRHLDD